MRAWAEWSPIRWEIEAGLFSPELRDPALRARMLARCALPPTATLLLGVGRHAPEKRWPMVVKAVTAVSFDRPVGLVLVGDGRDRSRIVREIDGNPHIHLISPVSNRLALARLMASSDALIHGCEAETFSMVAAEAAASGLPLIAPDRGGASDHARAQGGFCFASGDAADAARAIRDFMVAGAPGRFLPRARSPNISRRFSSSTSCSPRHAGSQLEKCGSGGPAPSLGMTEDSLSSPDTPMSAPAPAIAEPIVAGAARQPACVTSPVPTRTAGRCLPGCSCGRRGTQGKRHHGRTETSSLPKLLLIDRYVLRQVIAWYAIVVGVVMFLLCIETTPRLLVQLAGIREGPSLVARSLASLMPEYVAIALPIGLFLGTALTFRRLATAGELEVFAASGIGNGRLLMGPAMLGILTCALLVGLRGYIQPAGERRLDAIGMAVRTGQFGYSIEPGVSHRLGRESQLYFGRIDSCVRQSRRCRGQSWRNDRHSQFGNA